MAILSFFVIAGLEPAIHATAVAREARVKSGQDKFGWRFFSTSYRLTVQYGICTVESVTSIEQPWEVTEGGQSRYRRSCDRIGPIVSRYVNITHLDDVALIGGMDDAGD